MPRRSRRLSPRRLARTLAVPLLLCGQWAADAAGETNFFTTKVLPIFQQHCFPCHSHADTIKGGLPLDSASGLVLGGEGGPVIVPGDPDKSRLIRAVRYAEKDLRMPPGARLSHEEVATLETWVREGAQDPRPRTETTTSTGNPATWEGLYQERLKWWSLQPPKRSSPPEVTDSSWPRGEIDAFILAALEAEGLRPAPEADPRVLARRLHFALTGLPPAPELVDQFADNPTEAAYEVLVDSLLDSPHFGERWARHWMDVVHYSDTHGYEWDVPAKHAWRYRDYLVRAFNQDLPYQQLILEQIAGDLLPPRIDPETGINEALIGTKAMRLGERRHGDNADAEGVTQEAIANIIDTVSKGFLATTVACAQCHDHKLDAVSQRDYYAIAGTLMSSRWITRSLETQDPNEALLLELRGIKQEIREELGTLWADARDTLLKNILAHPLPEESEQTAKKPAKDTPEFPATLPALWTRLRQRMQEGAPWELAWQELADAFPGERDRRIAQNDSLVEIADFTREGLPDGWRAEGFGMTHGLAKEGEIIVAEEGDLALRHLVHAGRWSHLWSPRLAAALRSPLFPQDPAPYVSVGYAAGFHAAQSVVVDNAFHSERMKYLNQPLQGWLTVNTGNFLALAGGTDPAPRRVYLELVTKSLNNYYPARDAYGGLKQEDEGEERSWFGVTRVYQHPEGKAPLDSLERFTPLFAGSAPISREDAASRIAALVHAATEHWRQGTATPDSVRLINEALSAGWIPHDLEAHPALRAAVMRYRETAQRLQSDRTVGAVDDWHEGMDAPLAIRGSYTDLAGPVPRGNISFLGGPAPRAEDPASGRLELAQSIASPENPLTARVFVNRVWHYLLGQGLVRTVDDFGHLGERPTHPELLDWLALRFVDQGWSVKHLVRQVLTSSTWRQASTPYPAAAAADPENRLWHHHPLRRLEAEAIRDAMLAASGRLDPALFGPPIDPHRVAEDRTKRLYSGPLDGEGRRSLYLKMTLMEPPRFLALFNQPIPKLTVGQRDVTNVPDQALALLNDPFVIGMAEHWSRRLLELPAASPQQRVEHMFRTAFARPPAQEEIDRFLALARQSAELRQADPADLLGCQPVWQDLAHAIFNLKEFVYLQ